MAAKKKTSSAAKSAAKGSTKKVTAKTSAKKTIAKKSPAKKSVAPKAAKKVAVKMAAVKKPAAKKAPAKTVIVKKSAPVKKAAKKSVGTTAPPKQSPKKLQSSPVSPKKGIMSKEAPKATKTAAKKVVSKVPAAKKAESKKVPDAAPVAIQIAPLKDGKPTKAIVLSRGNGPVRRPKKPTTRATPKLEPRVKKDSSKNEAMFERTQSAPTVSAPKVTEFFQTSAYTTPEPVKPKANIRYSDKDLKMFRKLLESEKEKTLDELRMLKERLEDLTNYEASEETAVYSMHMAEQGSEAVEREKTYAQIQRTTDYLRKLDEALTRVDERTYGICRQCGILIAKERLMAVPITTLSASWKLRQQCPVDGVDRIGK